MSTVRIKLYTRQGCELCEQAKEMLGKLAGEHPHELVEVDIERDPALLARYFERIPVLEVGPYTLEAPIEELNLKVALKAAADSSSQLKPQSSTVSRDSAVFLNKLLYAISRRWLSIFNLLVLLYVGLPFLAPVLLRAGVERPARWIYTIYSPLCHQLPYRSWFLFGEQPAYPLELAGVEGITFEQVSAIPPGDLRVARTYTGDAEVGYKVALCERDVAIYGSILLGGLLFGLVRRRLRPMSIWLWFVVGIVPIALRRDLTIAFHLSPV